MHVLTVVGQRVRRVDEGDEIRRDQPRALMNELVERVLAVGARFSPEHLAGVGGDGGAVPPDGLAVGLHRQLLQVGREPTQLLRVGQHCVRLSTVEVDVPDVEQAHQHGDVALERGRAHMLVDGVETGQQLTERIRTERDGERKPDRGVDRVATAHPVPEPERVRRVDAERGDLVERGGHRHEVVCDGVGAGVVVVGDGAGGLEPGPQPIACLLYTSPSPRD